MEKTLLISVNFLLHFVGATIFGYDFSMGAIESQRNMLYSYRTACVGALFGGVAHFFVKLLIAAKFFDWYIYG